MKNSKLRRALLLVASAVLLVSISVSATLAYLTSKTEVVTNTFTVGNVRITLDEAKVDEYGVPVEGAERVKGNTYKLMPGHTYTKDPTVYVEAATATQTASEPCWLFVKVENGIAALEEKNADGTPAASAIVSQMTTKGWTLVEGQTDVYAYATKKEPGTSVVVFDNFKIDGNADVSNSASAQVKITAYAIQADGFTTAQAAWNAAPLTAEQWAN